MIRAYLSYWHKNSNGKTIKYRRYRSDSFVGNIIKFISFFMGNVTTRSRPITLPSRKFLTGHEIKRLDGTNFPDIAMAREIPLSAPSGNSDYGIVVGSGTVPVTLNDFRLQTKIPHGNLAGQLQYGDVRISTMDMSDPIKWFFNIARTFTNATTANITITEVGLIVYLIADSATGIYSPYYLIARDVLQEPITLAPNDSVLIQYRVNFRKT